MEAFNNTHDRGYKWLLSSREIFLQLLRSFVKEPWVDQIDEKDLRRADKSFIAKDFLEKEADLVYEVNLKGQTVVFYLLVELQRKVDFSMPYRLLNYMSGVWQNYLGLAPKADKIGQKEFRLPAIIPMVLYNGSYAWTAARSFREMLAGEALFGTHLLNFEYILLDVNRYSDAQLLQLANTIGAAFLLDKNSWQPEELRKLLGDLFQSLQNATEVECAIFLRWMRYIPQPRLSPGQQEAFESACRQLDGKEARKMVFANLEKSLDALEERGRMIGRKEGRREGHKEGRIEGREEGRKEGLMEGLEATALEMLREKIDINVVSRCTKLPLDRIQALLERV